MYLQKAEANFHFRSPRLFAIGALLDGLWRLMSYKLAWRRYTCSLYSLNKMFNSSTYYFILDSVDFSNKNNHSETNEKGSGKVICHTPIINSYWVPIWPRVIWKMDSRGDQMVEFYYLILSCFWKMIYMYLIQILFLWKP